MEHRLSWGNMTLAIEVWDRTHQRQHTVATSRLWMDCNPDHSIPTTKDIVNTIEQHSGRMNINDIPSLLSIIAKRYDVKSLGLSLCFPYFRNKTTAVTTSFDVSLHPDTGVDFILRIELSLSVQYKIEVAIRSERFIWIEELEERLSNLSGRNILSLQQEVANRLQTFQPTWFSAEITEQTDGELQQSIQWSWPQGVSPKQRPKSTPRSGQPFGLWLKEQRTQRQLSQQQLANALAISNSRLSRIESDQHAPTKSMLTNLAHHWGYDPNHLLLRARQPSTEMLNAIAEDVDGFLSWLNNSTS